MEKMLRVERGAPPRQERLGCIARQRRGHDDVAADRNVAALQRRCRPIRIGIGREQHVARGDLARRRRHRPSARLTPHGDHRDTSRQCGAGAGRRGGQSADIPRWLQCATSLVDEQAVVGVAANLGPLLGPRHELDAMAEHARQQCLLGLEIVEVTVGRRRLDVPNPLVVTLDPLVRDERFEPGDRGGRGFEEIPGAQRPVARDECRRVHAKAGENLTCVPRAGAPSHVLALHHEHVGARPRQRPRRRQPGVSGPDDHDVATPRTLDYLSTVDC
jgi:hypothetical protein